MSKEDYSIIDTKVWEPIQSPGLRAAKHQLVYDSPQIQKVLSEAFATMFPCIVVGDNKEIRYQSINSGGVDVFHKATPAKNISDIPRAEMMRLMEGWIRLRRKLQEEHHPDNVKAILLNFRVPNPRQSLDRYMLYKKGDEMRLIIRWGYETKEQKAVSLERAISILMDVPLGHMRSILSTTISQTTSTVPVGPLLAAAEAVEKSEKDAASRKNGKFNSLMATVLVGLFTVGGGIYLFSGAESPLLSVDEKVESDDYVFKIDEPKKGREQALVLDPEPAVVARTQPAEEHARVVAVTAVTEEKSNMESLMTDLVMGAEVRQSSQPQLSLDEMIQSPNTPKDKSADLLNEMMQ